VMVGFGAFNTCFEGGCLDRIHLLKACGLEVLKSWSLLRLASLCTYRW